MKRSLTLIALVAAPFGLLIGCSKSNPTAAPDPVNPYVAPCNHVFLDGYAMCFADTSARTITVTPQFSFQRESQAFNTTVRIATLSPEYLYEGPNVPHVIPVTIPELYLAELTVTTTWSWVSKDSTFERSDTRVIPVFRKP
jgi:hypothetical protein